jgi:hypothetical protein
VNGTGRPAAVSVRLTGPPEATDAAMASLADSYGDAWQPSTRKPSRYSGGEVVQYGTLLVTVPGPESRLCTGEPNA